MKWKNNNLLDRYEEKLTPLLDGALVGLPGYAYIDSTGTYNNTSHGPRIKIAKNSYDLRKTGGASTTITSDGNLIDNANYSELSQSDINKWSIFCELPLAKAKGFLFSLHQDNLL